MPCTVYASTRGGEATFGAECQNAPGALPLAPLRAACYSLFGEGGLLSAYLSGSVAMIMASRSAMSVSLQLPQMTSICGCGGPAAFGMMPSVCTESRSPK